MARKYNSGNGMKWYDYIVFILMVIGSINWGLVGFGFNLVEAIFGTGIITKIIYWLVGLSGLYSGWIFIKLIMHNKK